MARPVDLLLKITANTKGAVQEVDKVSGSLKGVEASTAKTQGVIAGSFGKVKAAIGPVSPAFLAIGGAAAAAGVAVGKFALDGAEKFAALTGEVRGVRRSMGGTAEEASQLTYALKITGVGAAAGASAFGMLSKKLGTGALDLSKYGVEVEKNKDGTTNLAGTVANLADAYSSTTDVTQRAALGSAAFGRGFQTLSPILLKSKEEIEQLYAAAGESGLIFSDEDLEKGRQFSVALKELDAAVEGFQASVGEAAVPALTALSQKMTGAVNSFRQLKESIDAADLDRFTGSANRLADSLPGIGTGFRTLQSGAKGLLETLPGIGPGIGLASRAVDLFGDSADNGQRAAAALAEAEAEAAYEAEQSAAAFDEATAALDRKNDATIASFSSDLAAQQANVDLATAIADGTAGLDLQKQALDTAGAQAQLAADNYEKLTGQAANATQKNDFLKQALINVGNQFPQLRPLLQGWIDQLGLVPRTVNTDVTVRLDRGSLDAAMNGVRSVLGTFRPVIQAVVVAPRNDPGGGADGNVFTPMAHGGPIPGSPSTAVPILAHGGEYVLSADVVSRIKRGAPSAGARVEGGARGMSSGGNSYQISVNVAPGGHPAEVGAATVDAIRAFERANGKGWRN